MKNKVLVVEDDEQIANVINLYLSKYNYDVMVASDGLVVMDIVKTFQPEIILLDLMLPYKSGDEVLKEIKTYMDIAVIVLSAKQSTQVKVDLLTLGADDYMVKPFDLSELKARIESLLRRCNHQQKTNELITYQNLVMDYELKIVKVNDKIIKLSLKEIEILHLFLSYPNKVFSKKNLYESVWNEEYAYDNDTINTHISNIRKKLDLDIIETVWGMGYKIK